MEKEEKINYEAPSSIVIDVKTEGVICQSGGVDGRGGYDPTDDNPFAG